MLVFIDDSGDPGFELDKGSTIFFVISCVVFDDELEAEKTAVAIKELRRKLKFPETVEFKFSQSSKITRTKFLETVNALVSKIDDDKYDDAEDLIGRAASMLKVWKAKIRKGKEMVDRVANVETLDEKSAD